LLLATDFALSFKPANLLFFLGAAESLFAESAAAVSTTGAGAGAGAVVVVFGGVFEEVVF
jgi:hypothetical protein